MSERRKRQLDVTGIVAFALMTLAFLMLLDLGARADGWDDPLVIISFAGFLLFGILFMLIEAYWATTPIIPLRLLKNPRVGLQYLVQFLCPIYGPSLVVRQKMYN